MSDWRAHWAAAPQFVPTRAQPAAAAAAAVAGLSFTALVHSVRPAEGVVRYTFSVQEAAGVALDAVHRWAHGARIENVALWRGGGGGGDVEVMDLVRVDGFHAASSTKTAGVVYLNCTRVARLRDCWALAADHAFMAAQPRADSGHPFMITSLSLEGDAGLCSQMQWPAVASSIIHGTEEPMLDLQWRHMQWDASDAAAQPVAQVLRARVWPTLCEQLVPSLALAEWKALMASGINAVPLALLCVLHDRQQDASGHALTLRVMALRSNLRAHLLQSVCPRVSQTTVRRILASTPPPPPPQKASPPRADGVVRVLGTALRPAHCIYHVMTSSPATVHTEDALCDALTDGTLDALAVFAVPNPAATSRSTPVAAATSRGTSTTAAAAAAATPAAVSAAAQSRAAHSAKRPQADDDDGAIAPTFGDDDDDDGDDDDGGASPPHLSRDGTLRPRGAAEARNKKSKK